jgi:hypothetical protein
MKVILDTQEEILVLSKMLGFIKFQSTDDIAVHIASSPITNPTGPSM